MHRAVLVLVTFALFLSLSAFANVYKTIASANKNARQHPALESYSNGAMVYDWEPNMLYQVHASPNRITNIQLEVGEVLNSVAAGDTTRWVVGDTSSGKGRFNRTSIYVKPNRANLHTNLIVSTSRRVYHFELHSFKDNYMASLSLNYPGPLVAIKKNIKKRKPNLNWKKKIFLC